MFYIIYYGCLIDDLLFDKGRRLGRLAGILAMRDIMINKRSY